MKLLLVSVGAACGVLFLLPLAVVAGAAGRFTSIFSFGDSYIDTGNYDILATLPGQLQGFNRPPFGMTFFGRPTGRATDGRVAIDFIASALGLPFLPPSQDEQHGWSICTGANFAVAHATALEESFFLKNGIQPVINASLHVQLDWFNARKPSACRTSKDQCSESLFAESLFVVGEFGVNDYLMVVLDAGWSLEKVRSSVVPKAVESICKAAEELVHGGAMTILVAGLPPFGCAPPLLTLFPTDDRDSAGCLRSFNALAQHHNSELLTGLLKLQAAHPRRNILYADYYRPTMNLIESPAQFGLKHIHRSCCGGGGAYNWNKTTGCGDAGATVCRRPAAYLHFDGFHYTDGANHFVADSWLKSAAAQQPNNKMSLEKL